MRVISNLLSALSKSALLALGGSAVAGGFALWLKSKGINPEDIIFEILTSVQSPLEKPITVILFIIVVLFIIFVSFYLIKNEVLKLLRPPLRLTQQLRQVLLDLRETALTVSPNEEKSNQLIKALRLIGGQLNSHKRLLRHIYQIEELTEDYLTRTNPDYITVDDEELAFISSVHDQAMKQLNHVLSDTGWAIDEQR